MHKDWREIETVEKLIDGLVANAGAAGTDAFREDVRDVIERAIEIHVGDGWAIVPKEPTPEMLAAINIAYPGRIGYKRMISVATTPNVELRRGREEETTESGGCCLSPRTEG